MLKRGLIFEAVAFGAISLLMLLGLYSPPGQHAPILKEAVIPVEEAGQPQALVQADESKPKEEVIKPVQPIPPPEPELNLTGIIYRSDKQSAIINDNIVRVGSILFGKEVINIQKDCVVLKQDDKQYSLKPGRKLQELKPVKKPLAEGENNLLNQYQEQLNKAQDIVLALIKEKTEFKNQVAQLQFEIKELETKIVELTGETKGEISKSQKLSENMLALRNKNAELKGKLIQLEGSSGRTQAELAREIEAKTNALNKAQSLFEKITQLTITNTELKTQKTFEESKTIRLQAELKKAVEEKVVTVNRAQEAENKARILQEEVEKSTEEKRGSVNRIKELENKVVTLQGQVKKVTKDFGSSRQKNTEFQVKNSELKVHVNELTGRNDRLHEEVKKTIEEKVEAIGQAKKTENKVVDLEGRISKTTENLDDSRQKNTELQAKNSELKVRVSELTQQNNDLQKGVAPLESNLKKQMAEATRYYKELLSAREKINTLAQTNIELKDKLASQSGTRTLVEHSLNKQLTNLRDEARHLTLQKQELTGQLKRANERQLAQTNELNRLENRNTKLIRQVEELKAKLDETKQDRAKYYDQFKETNVKITGLSRENQELTESLRKVSEENHLIESQLKGLRSQLELATKQLSGTETESSQLTQTNLKLEMDLRNEISARERLSRQFQKADAKVVQLVKDNAELSNKNLVLSQEVQVKGKELAETIQQVEYLSATYSSQITSGDDRVSGLNQRISLLQDENKALVETNLALKKDFDTTRQQKDELADQLDRLTKGASVFKESETGLKNKVLELETKINSLNNTVNELSASNEQLKKENDDKASFLNEIKQAADRNQELYQKDLVESRKKDQELQGQIALLKEELRVKEIQLKQSGGLDKDQDTKYAGDLTEANQRIQNLVNKVSELELEMELKIKDRLMSQTVEYELKLNDAQTTVKELYYALAEVYEKSLNDLPKAIQYYRKYKDMLSFRDQLEIDEKIDLLEEKLKSKE